MGSEAELTGAENISLVQLIKAQDWRAVEVRLAKSPEEASVRSPANLFRSNSLCYPLHYLCKKPKAPLSTMQALIKAAPVATSSMDAGTKSLPIHIACWYGQPLESVRALLGANMASLTVADKDSRNLPLHVAASLASPDVVQLLLQTDPRTASKLNKKKQTPLHCACMRRDISVEVLTKLIEISPTSAACLDWLNRCPVHDACMQQADVTVLERLLKAFPGGVLLWDKHLLTPYGILRTRFRLQTRDPAVVLIRKYMQKQNPALIRFRNTLQFLVEDVKAGFGRDEGHSLKGMKKLPQ